MTPLRRKNRFALGETIVSLNLLTIAMFLRRRFHPLNYACISRQSMPSTLMKSMNDPRRRDPTRYSTGNCESRSCSLLVSRGGRMLRNFFNSSRFSPVKHETAKIGHMLLSTNMFAAFKRSSSLFTTNASSWLDPLPCFRRYVKQPMVCWILVFEQRSILLITTKTGTFKVIAYEKCSRVVSTRCECSERKLDARSEVNLPTLEGASTQSMAKSAAWAERPNSVVFMYLVWPARSLKVMTRNRKDARLAVTRADWLTFRRAMADFIDGSTATVIHCLQDQCRMKRRSWWGTHVSKIIESENLLSDGRCSSTLNLMQMSE